MTEFQYDVGFSFLACDESFATQLNDLLQDRFKTFLYSKQQETVAGTDGELSFNDVFAKQCRTVAVLYRDGWGETPWTRIEETAIRNRAYDEGYNFVIFIPLDDPPAVPKWLPRTYLWLGLKRFGLRGAAAVLESKIQEHGGDPAEESVSDRAARHRRNIDFVEEQRKFQNSEVGVQSANASYEALIAGIDNEKFALSEAAIPVKKFGHADWHRCVFQVGGVFIDVHWNCRFRNSLDKAYLRVEFLDGLPKGTPGFMWDEPRRLQNSRFIYQLTRPEHAAWVSEGPDQREYSSEDLTNFILRAAMDIDERLRRTRR
jgi:hypothetical protein